MTYKFHTLFWCFHYWPWASKYRLEISNSLIYFFIFTYICRFVWKLVNVFCVFVNLIAIVPTIHHSKKHTEFILLQKRVVSLWTVIGVYFLVSFLVKIRKLTNARLNDLKALRDTNRKKYHKVHLGPCQTCMMELFIRNSFAKKWSFPLRISAVNVTKSAGNCGLGYILLKSS